MEQNKKYAADWYRKAAAQGNALAQNALGIMYMRGDDIPRDDKQAFDLFRQAARKRIPEAIANLGLMYAKGQGTAKNYPYAYTLAHHAARNIRSAARLESKLSKIMTPDDRTRAASLTIDEILNKP